MQDSQVAVLLEDISGKLDGLTEAVTTMQDDINELKRNVAPIPQIQNDIETLKIVQREQGKDLRHISGYLVEQGMPARA